MKLKQGRCFAPGAAEAADARAADTRLGKGHSKRCGQARQKITWRPWTLLLMPFTGWSLNWMAPVLRNMVKAVSLPLETGSLPVWRQLYRLCAVMCY